MTSKVCLAVSMAGGMALLAGASVARADGNGCSFFGAWTGTDDLGFAWTSVVTPGQSARDGQLQDLWTLADPTLGGLFPTAVRLTDGAGSAQVAKHDLADYTMLAYGLDASGHIVYVNRIDGSAQMNGCNEVDLTSVVSIFAPGQDVFNDTPAYGSVASNGVLKRIPVVTPAP